MIVLSNNLHYHITGVPPGYNKLLSTFLSSVSDDSTLGLLRTQAVVNAITRINSSAYVM